MLEKVNGWQAKVDKGGCASPACRGRHAKGRSHCQKCRMREWRATHPLEAAMLRIRASAKKRKIKFTLTIDEFRVWAKESGFEASKLAK